MLGLDKKIQYTANEQVMGQWHQIQIVPDITTRERFNIGVAVEFKDGIQCKLLENFERFKCLYGESYINTIKLLVEAARLTVESGALVNDNHLYFSKRFSAKGSTEQEVLDYLFDDTVPLNKSTDKQLIEKKESAQRLNQLILYIKNRAKENYGLKADDVFPADSEMLVKYESHTVRVNIPVRSKTSLGTIILANQKSAQSIESNLNRGASNIHIAKNVDTHHKKHGVIILLSDYGDKHDNQIDDKLDRFYVDMKSSNIDIISNPNKPELADMAYQWASR
jgi:hypothetical protein